MTLQVRKLSSGEWTIYRQLRLRALEESPDAFGTTYARAISYPDEVWISRLSNVVPERDLPLIAEIDAQPGGLAWGRIDPEDEDTAHVYQMWVAPEFRGRGAGVLLLDTILTWSRTQRAAKVALAVTCGDSPARRMYERAGFVSVGRPEPIRPGSNILAQPMELGLRSNAA